MKFKCGVNPDRVQWQIGYALCVAEFIYDSKGYDLVVTSLTDGTHNPNSLHPKGLAADLRTIGVTEVEDIFQRIKDILSPSGYDVVWEGGVGATPATTGAHIHIEFQPKGEQKWPLETN